MGIQKLKYNLSFNFVGFLSYDTNEIPGNAGMLDQVAALQWVRDHISVFGGNVNEITIMGESAGSASVSLHNISPMSTGKFIL
jgi:acetylcholinesterase